MDVKNAKQLVEVSCYTEKWTPNIIQENAENDFFNKAFGAHYWVSVVSHINLCSVAYEDTYEICLEHTFFCELLI